MDKQSIGGIKRIRRPHGPSITLTGAEGELDAIRARDEQDEDAGALAASSLGISSGRGAFLTWDGGRPSASMSDLCQAAEEQPSGSEAPTESAAGEAPGAATQSSEPVPPSLHRPCATCRTARVLCDRFHPCGRCMRLNLEATCAAPPTVKRGRPPKVRLRMCVCVKARFAWFGGRARTEYMHPCLGVSPTSPIPNLTRSHPPTP